MIGWIKLHRQLLEWEWYDDINVRLVFLHCLLKANFKDKNWQGNTIKRGSFISSYGKLSDEIGITVKQLRIALNKLERTNEMAIKSTTKNTTFQLVKYNDYQSEDKQEGKPKADEGQTKDKQRATTKESNNRIIEERKELELFFNDSEKMILFNTWIDYRKEIKKTIKSDTTLKSLKNKIKKEDYEKSKWVIENSIENQYQGLFWDNYKQQKQKNNDTINELSRQIIEEQRRKQLQSRGSNEVDYSGNA